MAESTVHCPDSLNSQGFVANDSPEAPITHLSKTDQADEKVIDECYQATELPESISSDVSLLCRDAFEKISNYIQGELAGTAEEYKLLEQMNLATLEKYNEMKKVAANINSSIAGVNEKYENLQPYLDKIDQIEESVLHLEQSAYKLDAYSKRLEAKFKQLEKR